MRYWQVSLRRLSRAASKYQKDGAWHRSEAAGPLIWYRVPDKRWLQRVQFTDFTEEELLLPMLTQLPALPDLGQTTGFREETRFGISGGTIYQEILLGYTGAEEPAVKRQLDPGGVRVEMIPSKEGLLYARTPIATFSLQEITRAAEILQVAKQQYLEGTGSTFAP